MEAELVETIKNGDLEKLQDGLAQKKYQKFVFKNVLEGDFPLHVAVKARNEKIVRVLLEAGANPNQGTEARGTHSGYTPAHEAASNGDIDILKVLHEFNADFNRCSDDQWYPLHCAVYKGHLGAINFLLDHGANVNCATNYKQTPLCFAASHGRARDVRLLLKRGASVKSDPSMDTLLHHTMHYRMSKLFEGNYDVPDSQLDVAVILALNGVDPSRVNDENETAFQFFEEDIPHFQQALSIIFNNAIILASVPTEWNYLTFVDSKMETLVGLGIPSGEAKALCETMKLVESERHEAKARRLAERPTGGCPVMRGKRCKQGAAAAGSEGSSENVHTTAGGAATGDGSDPSGGKCPFFQKGKSASSSLGADVGLPQGHPFVPQGGSGTSAAGGGDPSGGKCPFFQKSNEPSDSKTDASRGKLTSSDAPSSGCAVLIASFQRNAIIFLLMGMSFIFGMWVDQVFISGRQA